EHTDYNGGTCLPVALPHRTFVALTPREDTRVRLTSAQAPGELWEADLAQVAPGQVDGWGAYVVGVAWALAQEGAVVGGFDAAVTSAVPTGAGLSSSAAIECATALALDSVAGLGLATDDDGLARLADACVRAENEIVGAPTGGMDQAVSLRSHPGHALLLDTLDHSVRHVPLDLDAHGLALLVIDTRAPHALVDGQYGERRAACERAAAALGVATLREVTDLGGALETLGTLPDAEVVRRRVRHVVTEIERVELLTRALESGDMAAVGHFLDEGHASLRDDYEVSCRELDLACEAAVAAGALGARMTGGGFGGSAVALVREAQLDAVAAAVTGAFADAGLTTPGFLRGA
ncbi:MAG: galactokinase, partial [Actinomycetales bacterium]|nr:galactokinase [Actinomycetales bacterium]